MIRTLKETSWFATLDGGTRILNAGSAVAVTDVTRERVTIKAADGQTLMTRNPALMAELTRDE